MLKRPSRVLVADLGASHVSHGVFSASAAGGLTLEQLFVERLEGDLSLESVWRQGTASSLGKLRQVPNDRGQLSVSLPGHLCLTKFMKIPAVERAKRARIIGFEAAQNIPYPLSEVVWDHVWADPNGEREIMISAVKMESMTGLCAAMTSSGHVVRSATPSFLALYNAFQFNHPDVRESTLLIDVGARSTHVVLAEDERFIGRTLPGGGNVLTQGIAEELGVDFRAAERLKIETFARDGKPLTQAEHAPRIRACAEKFSRKLATEIARSLLSFREQGAFAHPTLAYITGGCSQVDLLAAIIEERLRLSVQPFEALRGVKIGSGAQADVAQFGLTTLAPLVGLAATSVGYQRKTLNLLPIAIRNELAFRRRQPVVIAAVVMIVGALIPPLDHFHSGTNAADVQALEVEAQARPLRELQSRQAKLSERIAHARTAIFLLQEALDKKTTWLRFFADLQERLGEIEDVWVESLSVAREATAGRDRVRSPVPGNPADFRLVLTGRLLDERNPVSKVSPESYDRIKRLIESVSLSEFVSAVEGEQFDNSQPGILRFGFTLVVRPERSL